ncbi:telomeric repeat binding factor a [Echeneis naucrates]|uniref:telomeric repeat binding factor a n=1 Tax=Echeneis naucrates TaxID=173247 RepID=UPI001114340E|nr:telomeric repeat-binding factor 2 [Echeneis naucrates]
MAARKAASEQATVTESIVSRWLVDYYVFLALESFKNDHYKNFCAIRNVLNGVLARPLESTDTMPAKIQVLQFLSRIIEGERLDLSFDYDPSITPLESALLLLQEINQECNIPQQDFENICTSVKEMMVGILIKNNEFEKAKEVLKKHFPKTMGGKKAVFLSLISKQSKMHEVIELMDFRQFKAEMLAFCQTLCSFSVPFLHKAAKQLIDKRLSEQDAKATGIDEQDEPCQSSAPQMSTPLLPCKRTTIQRTKLEEAYKALASFGMKTFAQLEEELEKEEWERTEDISLRLSPIPKKATNQDRGFQRDSGSPIEASPADQTAKTHTTPQTPAGSLSKLSSAMRKTLLYTVAQLVVEPDSQPSSQCSTASPEVETNVRTEDLPQSLSESIEKNPQSLLTDTKITKPSRKLPRRVNRRFTRASASKAELATDSDEDTTSSRAKNEIHVRKRLNQSSSPHTCSSSVTSDGICVVDTSLDSSSNLSSSHPVPQTSSTPQKGPAEEKDPSISKWKQLYKNAKEGKEIWSDEESYFNSKDNKGDTTISGHRKRKWTESETQQLREGVKKFGEGNWGKIKAYYNFNGRTNVNLKDRWRTMIKLKMV